MSKHVIAVLLLCLGTQVLAAELKVAASIQPLHSLTAAVMAGAGQPAQVVNGLASEHAYALKPSDARLVQAADLVVLVSPAYETFLAKPLAAARADVLALAQLPGITRLDQREGGAWEAHAADHDHGHSDRDETDFHLWLDPANAKLLVAALADKLAAKDPSRAALYRANAQATLARLDALDGELFARLAPVKARPYVVFHDAYQYFEARYGLNPVGAVTIDPDRPPSAKRMATLRDRIKSSGTACVFREPQFPSPLAASLAQAAGARLGVLDPQGADLAPGPDLYFTMMRRLAESLSSCLSGG
ncbi:zinc ABC transporter substrate-binding protein [Magnetospirillum moscoviense]|uniref:High-affinity zinc uptake system protein ZnuA n=1 Tax=Magnetospirillum moscoviense TaxID=1437059 RepID=A0A178MJE3_9PROT|nr:zinc ABC transporter substrate-binding protein [Magnetospirillum moscoviense]OAN48683.1 zinc ABC transporter substrate-binding protein [Magnetospirillum moscoviense]